MPSTYQWFGPSRFLILRLLCSSFPLDNGRWNRDSASEAQSTMPYLQPPDIYVIFRQRTVLSLSLSLSLFLSFSFVLALYVCIYSLVGASIEEALASSSISTGNRDYASLTPHVSCKTNERSDENSLPPREWTNYNGKKKEKEKESERVSERERERDHGFEPCSEIPKHACTRDVKRRVY